MSLTKEKAFVISLMLIFILFCLIYNWGSKIAEGTKTDKEAKIALLKILGTFSLAITYECTSVRNPIEGCGGCLDDIPAGYCYHLSCDLVSPPKLLPEEVYQVKIIKNLSD